MSVLKRLKSDLFLGYRAVVAHPLKKLLDDDPRSGRERFLAHYGQEGLLPTTDEDREILQGASRCIHCGLCDSADPSMSSLPRSVYLGPSQLAVALSRATPDLIHARASVQALRPDCLAQAEQVCPTRVPLVRIASYLSRKLSELDRALG